jgi:hypothetical protein
LAASPNPAQRDIDLILREDIIPRRLVQLGTPLWPREKGASRAALRAVVSAELDILVPMEERIQREVEAPAHAEAARMALARAVKEQLPLVRAVRNAEQSYAEACAAIQKHGGCVPGGALASTSRSGRRGEAAGDSAGPDEALFGPDLCVCGGGGPETRDAAATGSTTATATASAARRVDGPIVPPHAWRCGRVDGTKGGAGSLVAGPGVSTGPGPTAAADSPAVPHGAAPVAPALSDEPETRNAAAAVATTMPADRMVETPPAPPHVWRCHDGNAADAGAAGTGKTVGWVERSEAHQPPWRET